MQLASLGYGPLSISAASHGGTWRNVGKIGVNKCNELGGDFDNFGTCFTPPPSVTPPPPPPPPPPTPSPAITVQTQVSPQISPVFQQAFQPSGSPMTAGTAQTIPTSQSGTAPGPDYTTIIAEQRKMYEAMLAKATQPVIQQPPQFAQPAPAVMSPVPMTEQAMVAFPEPGTEPKTTPAVVAPLQKANYMPIILIVAAVVTFAALGQQKGKRHAT